MIQSDKLHLYDHITLNEGAYFYKKGEVVIDNKAIDNVFNTVLKDVKFKVWTVIKRREERNGLKYADVAYCSLLIFESASNPSFFDYDNDNFPKELKEKKLSYLLIVEIEDYVVIVRKNVSHLSPFLNQLEVIEGNRLGNVLVNDETVFQQLKLTSMNMNENAMRNKSYEANNLENAMPTFGSNQNIIQTARLRTSDGLCTLNINTSRIAKFGNKRHILTLVVWMDNFTHALENYNGATSFLTKFALPVSWKNKYLQLEPVALLINVFTLQNFIQNLENRTIYRQSKQNQDRYDDCTELFNRLTINGVKCLQLTKIDDKNYSCSELNDGIIVRKNKTGLKLVASKTFGSFYCKDNSGEFIPLIDVINMLACFTVSFTDYSYIYSGRRIYQNSKITEDMDTILSIFEGNVSMKTVTSEKGEYTADRTEFSENSIFYVVENEYFPNADSLICDDMGNEWADHIAIRGNTISFIHSKFIGKTSLSASYFQEVIGQAVKNIGNLTPDDAALENKRKCLLGYMKNTHISKCRIGSVQEFIDKFKYLRNTPNLTKEVCVAIDFISRDKLKDAFDKIKNNRPLKQKHSVLQMVWLLNGFISICKERDLHCRIFCKP